ncbi:MAG: phosphoribosylglycinamide synthetase, partial [Rhizomicrobium sp.]
PAKGDLVFGGDGKAYVIEIAARLSGGNFCYDKVPWATGVDIVDILIDMAVDNPVDHARFNPTRNRAASQRYFFPPPGRVRTIRGIEAAQAMPHVRKVDVWVRPGEEIASLQNHPSRVGYVISVAPKREEAVAAAEQAVKLVEFVMGRAGGNEVQTSKQL